MIGLRPDAKQLPADPDGSDSEVNRQDRDEPQKLYNFIVLRFFGLGSYFCDQVYEKERAILNAKF
jgi:hypothetical protein